MSNDGKDCENLWKTHAKNEGCKVIPTGIGSDYVKFCPDEAPVFVEVKDGCHDISPMQKITRDIVTKVGFDYEVKRCNCDLED